jgi:protein-tyrosine phosphatase
MRYKRLLLQDIGGLKNEENREVRRGLLYRSGELHRLRPRDLALMHSLGIRQIIDLREEEMLRKRPDQFTAPSMINLPVRLGSFGDLKLREALRREVDWSRFDFHSLYTLILDENKDYIRRFLELLVAGPHPVLLHCTAGKDRTGVFITVLLLALRLSREQVVRWYLSIERHLKRNTPLPAKFLVWYSKTPREVIYLNKPGLLKALDHLEQRYQGVEGYLEEAGFTALHELRRIFLR